MATSGRHTSSKTNAIHHYNQNTQIAAYLSPDLRNVKDRKTPIRNHMADYRRSLKDMQEQMKQRRLSEQQGKEWKMRRFKDVKSKVADIIQHPRPSYEATPGTNPTSTPTHDFLKRGTLNKRIETMSLDSKSSRLSSPRTAEEERPIPAILSEQFSQGGISARSSEGRHSDSDAVPRKPAVPRHTDMAKLNPRSHRNHIIENRRQADRLLPPSASRMMPADCGPAYHENYGQVPAYLQERKQEWAEEEARRRAALPDPDCPPGMRMLTEEERQEYLNTLALNEQEIRRQMTRIPLQVDTPSLRRKRDALDQQLAEIDRNRDLFSKPKVFVVNEDE